MKKKTTNLIARISLVTTTFLMGVMTCGTFIANENIQAINNFLGEKDYKLVETGDENQDKEYFKTQFNSIKDLIEEGKKTCYDIESEGATLIVNKDNTLPLKKAAKVSLFGEAMFDPAYGGRGSAQVGHPMDPITPVEGYEQAGFDVNKELDRYIKGDLYMLDENGEIIMEESSWGGPRKKKNKNTTFGTTADKAWAKLSADTKMMDSIKAHGDAAIFMIKRTGGEGSDLQHSGQNGYLEGDYLKLSENEDGILKGLKKAKDDGIIKKIIVVMNTANQVQIDYDSPDYAIDAALWVGSMGVTGNAAIGDIVSGKVNPSGHLSDTYWYRHQDNPVLKNTSVGGREGAYKYANIDKFMDQIPVKSGWGGSGPDKGFMSYRVYQEGIYLGYRYAETRYADVVTNRANVGTFDYDKTIFKPFGYGLSYTDFEQSNMKVVKNGKDFEISVDVKNVGKVAGKDAVQVYVQKPYTDFDIQRGIEKSAIDLVGFEKTKVIEPGQTERVTVTVKGDDLKVYDANESKTYIITEGDYTFTTAYDAHSAINNILAKQGYTNLVGKGDANLAKSVHLGFDDTTYSKSTRTGHKIKNLFDFVDPNKYEHKGDNKVTFVSRNNWEGTLPKETVKMNMNQDMLNDLLAQEKPETVKGDKDAKYPEYNVDSGLQLIDMMKDKDGNEIPYDSQAWDAFMDQLTWEETVKLNSIGLRKTAAIERLGKPETLDHNGPCGLTQYYDQNKDGLATRKNDPDKHSTAPYYPCLGIMTATFNHDLAKKFGRMLGEDAIWAGYSGFYGVAVNTHRSPYEGRAHEYLSEDPYLAGTLAADEVKEMQAKGLNAYIKHFVNNDEETQRNGVSVWNNEQALREIYLRPFEKTVVDANAMNAMSAFVRIGVEHCPASHALLTDFLRGELGMKGFVVTDMYSIGYKAEQMPVFTMAGCDIPDGGLDKQPIFDKYSPDKGGYGNVAMQMRESAKRQCYATVHSIAMNNYSSTTKIVPITTQWRIALTATTSTIGVLFGISLLYTAYAVFKALKK